MTEHIEDMSHEEKVARGYATRDCGYCKEPIRRTGQMFAQYGEPWGVCHVIPCGDLIQGEDMGYKSRSEWELAEARRRIDELEQRVMSLEKSLKAAFDTMYSVTGE